MQPACQRDSVVRPAASAGEAQRRLKPARLNTTAETLAAQTAQAKGAITVTLEGYLPPPPKTRLKDDLASAHDNKK